MTAVKGRALVVEDSRTVALVIKRFLEMNGFEVLVAADGAVGLDMARRERPRVVVADVHLPGLGGLDIVRALRSDAATREILIFIQSSDAGEESRQQALAAGADDYIVKPFKVERLAALLESAAQRESTSRG